MIWVSLIPNDPFNRDPIKRRLQFYLSEKIDCVVDEIGRHCDADDKDESDEEKFEGNVSHIEVPFHAVNCRHFAERR